MILSVYAIPMILEKWGVMFNLFSDRSRRSSDSAQMISRHYEETAVHMMERWFADSVKMTWRTFLDDFKIIFRLYFLDSCDALQMM